MVLYIRKIWGFEVDTLSLSLESNVTSYMVLGYFSPLAKT